MPTLDSLLDEVYGPEQKAAPAPAPKAGVAPAGAPSDNSLGSLFSNYVGGPIQDYLVNAIQSASGPGMVRDVSQFLTKAAVPDTLTGAAVTGATLLAPQAKAAEFFGTQARNAPKLLPAVKRMLYPIMGGAAGGLAEKGDPTDAMMGAGLGALTGIPAEAASWVSRWFGASQLAQRFYKEDPETFGKVVRDLVPEFGKLENPKDFGEKVFQGVAQDKLSQVYDKRMTMVADKVKESAQSQGPMAAKLLYPDQPTIGPGGRISSPTINRLTKQGVIGGEVNYTVDDLMQDIRDLRFKARTPKGDPKLTLDARQARDYASELSADLGQAIRNSNMPQAKQIANYYNATDRKYARGAEMLRYLKQKGVVDENGKLNMKLLQEQMKVERAYGLSHVFEPEEFEQLMGAVFRGADATVIDKIVKTDPYVGVHASERGSLGIRGNLLNMLRNNKYAGNYDVNFLKPKTAAVAAQRLPAGLLGNLNRPISLGDDSE